MECRICLESDNTIDMISPCLCRGSCKYIHRECLNEWFDLSNNPDAKIYCLECQFKYHRYVLIKIPINRLVLMIYKYPYISFMLYQGLILLLHYILDQLYVFEYSFELYNESKIFFYINNYFISGCIILLFGIIGNIILVCNVKDKKKYFKNYNFKLGSIIAYISMVTIIFVFFIPSCSIILSSLLIIQLVRNHYIITKKTIDENYLIISYNDDEIDKIRNEII